MVSWADQGQGRQGDETAVAPRRGSRAALDGDLPVLLEVSDVSLGDLTVGVKVESVTRVKEDDGLDWIGFLCLINSILVNFRRPEKWG
jgi:hypothetical protein